MSNALSCVFIIIINVLHSIGLFGGGKREQWCCPPTTKGKAEEPSSRG